MNNIRTVSDTKRTFYSLHTRPINSIYRRVVEELMVEMHLLSVNVDFSYDPIYALGVVTAFDRFMQGYQPSSDQDSIFNALIKAEQDDPQKYRGDAQHLTELAKTLSVKDLIVNLKASPDQVAETELLGYFRSVATNPKWKYSRLYAIGLFTLLEVADPHGIHDKATGEQILTQLAEALHLPQDKLIKDLDLYRSNLEKVAQARIMIEEMTQAERKKREQRANEAVGLN
ncbi:MULTISPECIES: photosystem II biogenesis protein Psp29 [Planktothrix]|uniref:Protein Thf1 n=1 Tax=Planktothrix mougeotii LEGE 06226 TaxID=1828728 RepID=A0ABR9UBS3_9CYAN|nr:MULTISPECIES: photosystem II biogenesis protein Psp29 [Planktothrix]MBD2482939.1 photosystem II biogenesis protein Psp29 [Planktothrix sp. FACHB-1365]MBE9143904.1 photosystem II biogenesis protein Psp29 [Planktothrix mougeotii LEGE 06226]